MPAKGSHFTGTTLENIVRLGFCGIALWGVSLILTSWYAPVACRGMLRAVGYHAAGGRAAGISAAVGSGLPNWLVVILALFVDMTVVLLFYPLIVYSYERGLRRRLLGGTLDSTLESARKQRRSVSRYGIVGLLFFVWFPFYMTGPLIGAVIGYFLGLRPWVNLATVGSGTFLAIISWTFLFDQLHKFLEEAGSELVRFVPLVVVVLVLGGLAAVRLRRGRKPVEQAAEGPEEPPEGEGPPA